MNNVSADRQSLTKEIGWSTDHEPALGTKRVKPRCSIPPNNTGLLVQAALRFFEFALTKKDWSATVPSRITLIDLVGHTILVFRKNVYDKVVCREI